MHFCVCSELDNEDEEFENILNRFRREIGIGELESPELVLPKNETVKSPTKNHTVSWKEVNELFNRDMDEDEVAEKWQGMEKKLKTGIFAFLLQLLL